MSIVISGIRLPYEQADAAALAAARRRCRVDGRQGEARIYKRSLDLRHGKLSKVFSVQLDLPAALEEKILSRTQDPNVRRKARPLELSAQGKGRLSHPPVVVGLGPAGLFAALVLAEQGYRPLVLEQGPPMEERDRAILQFNQKGVLSPLANIQFGEGGAGAYSDGKLTTRIHDPRCELVLERLLAHGAPPETEEAAKPHIGTDRLKGVVVSLRQKIQALGGQVCFRTRVERLRMEDGRLAGLVTDQGDDPLRDGHFGRGTQCPPLV